MQVQAILSDNGHRWQACPPLNERFPQKAATIPQISPSMRVSVDQVCSFFSCVGAVEAMTVSGACSAEESRVSVG